MCVLTVLSVSSLELFLFTEFVLSADLVKHALFFLMAKRNIFFWGDRHCVACIRTNNSALFLAEQKEKILFVLSSEKRNAFWDVTFCSNLRGGGGGKRGINVIAEISLRVLMQSYLFFR